MLEQKEDFAQQMQEYKNSMKSLLMSAKSNQLSSQQTLLASNSNSKIRSPRDNSGSRDNLHQSMKKVGSRSPRDFNEDAFNKKILFLTDKVAALSANMAEMQQKMEEATTIG